MLTYFDSNVPKDNVSTIAFYNVENLYDVIDDPNTFDEEFTPRNEKHWTQKRLQNKLDHLTDVITHIGLDHAAMPPILVGLAEVENELVLKELVLHKTMIPYQYDFVHFDSPDGRGIEVALLFQSKFFEIISTEKYPLLIFEPNGDRDYTRDILCVKGNFNGEYMCIIVNHWPSRINGTEASEYKRLAAAGTIFEIINKIKTENDDAKIVVMGDFNDEWDNASIIKMVHENNLYNPMQSLKDKAKGTSYSQNRWYLFDQIFFSMNFFQKEKNKHTLKYAEIFDVKFIKTWHGKRKNTPYRTYVGKWHQGGFSDHFPVLAYLERF